MLYRSSLELSLTKSGAWDVNHGWFPLSDVELYYELDAASRELERYLGQSLELKLSRTLDTTP